MAARYSGRHGKPPIARKLHQQQFPIASACGKRCKRRVTQRKQDLSHLAALALWQSVCSEQCLGREGGRYSPHRHQPAFEFRLVAKAPRERSKQSMRKDIAGERYSSFCFLLAFRSPSRGIRKNEASPCPKLNSTSYVSILRWKRGLPPPVRSPPRFSKPRRTHRRSRALSMADRTERLRSVNQATRANSSCRRARGGRDRCSRRRIFGHAAAVPSTGCAAPPRRSSAPSASRRAAPPAMPPGRPW